MKKQLDCKIPKSTWSSADTRQSAGREFFKYTSLNVLGMVGLSCYILADTFFISKGLGANGLAALNLALPIYSFIHGCGLMLGMGGGTKYSIFRGQNASKNADAVFTNTLYMAVVFAGFFMLMGIFFSQKLTLLLGADAEIADMTKTYLRVILLCSPAFIMNNICICFVRNDGNPRLSLLAMLGGSFSNIILDYIFIFPLHMGILGAVLATGIAPVISMGILSKHLLSGERGFHAAWERPRTALFRSLVSLGFPSLVTEISSGIVIIIFNMLFLKLAGNVGIAAYGVIANLSLVVVAIYNGIAQGIQPVISRAYGKKEKGTIRQTFRYGVFTVVILSILIYAVMFLFADPITRIFNSEGNARLQELAGNGMKLYFTVVPFVGFNILVSAYFTSIERTVPAQVISVVRGFLLIIPMAFALAALAGITGVWLAFPVTEGIVCLMGVGMCWRMKNSMIP